MSRIVDLPSKKIGEWLLNGWVLTDEQCKTPDCPIPLMRSVDRRVKFCVRCDEGPHNSSQMEKPTTQSEQPHSPGGSTSSTPSRVSTPPTDIHDPTLPDFELPPLTEEAIRRRDQSDRAAREIGQRMLRGWAMLADECPNESCYGVPLVRPPASLPGNKECVICRTQFTTEKGLYGQASVRPILSTSSLPVDAPSQGSVLQTLIERPQPHDTPRDNVQSSGYAVIATTSSARAISDGVSALESALRALSGRMAALSQADASSLDHVLIGEIASQMTLVLGALREAKSLS